MPKKIKTPSAKIIARKVGNKPYYEIEYYDMKDKITHIGYSSYDLKKVVGWIVEYFDIIPDIDLIKEQPTAYVMGVVRCKDCKHRHSSEFCECREENAFCSDGECKDSDENHDDNSSES